MDDSRYKLIQTADDMNDSIYGISHKRYIVDLPNDFSCKSIRFDTSSPVGTNKPSFDICYDICFFDTEFEGVYYLVPCPGNTFLGYIGNCLFKKWTKMIWEGSDFIFKLSPKGGALPLCIGLLERFLAPGGYTYVNDNGGYKTYHQQVPYPFGYAVGNLNRLNAAGEILRWSCNPGNCNASNANSSFADKDKIRLLDLDNKQFPAAFSIKLGKGRLSVYPQCVDIETILSPDECSLRGALGDGDEKPNSDNCFVISLPFPPTGKKKERADITINVKQPKKKKSEEHHVTVRCFIEFLVIFLACNMGDGIALIPGNLEHKKPLIAGLKKNGRRIVMMFKEKSLKLLPGGELFFNNASNVDTQIQRCINNVLFNDRDPAGVDDLQSFVRGRMTGDPRLKIDDYSVERLQNISLNLSHSDIKSLGKIRFMIPDESEAAGTFKPLSGFNKNANKFFNALEKLLLLKRELSSDK